MGIIDTLRQVRMAGLGASLRTLKYTLYRDRLNARFKNRPWRAESRGTGKLESIQKIEQGVQAHFEHADLELFFLAPDLARVSWKPGLAPIPYALEETAWPKCEVQTSSKAGEENWPETLETQCLRVQIGAYGDLAFYQARDSAHLRIDHAPTWRGEACSHSTHYPSSCGFFGLGEQATRLERNGNTYQLWNSDPRGKYRPDCKRLYTGIPVYLVLQAQSCQLVFYENSYQSTFHFEEGDSQSDRVEAGFEGGMLRYYLMTGNLSEVYERYSQLTGRSPLPPRWALGYHQCRWGYKSADEIRRVVAGFREHQLPISAIHLDIDYMDGYRVFSVDPTRFADLPGLAKELDDEGVKLVTILDPGVKIDRQDEVYQSGLKAGVFCRQGDDQPMTGVVWPGWCAFPDFSDPSARRWWGDYYPRLLEAGVAGIWHDMNEPTSFTAWGDMTLPATTQHAMEGRGGDHREAHNLYGLLMDRAGYEAFQRHCPDRRPWILSRSGWAGMQRYAWSWTGDVETSWPALQLTLSTVLGMGLSGQPYCGPDIGGFSGNPSAELYLRWLQMAVFLPFCRTHSATGTARREPWVFGEPTTRIVREFLNLRYRLTPYLYTLAWQSSRSGVPIVRPLFWLDLGDAELWGIQDCFLLGENLLVAPVLEEGAQTRRVHLPKGSWYSFWDDTCWQAGTKRPEKVQLTAPLERIPVLVKAGSLLPMIQGDILELNIYPPMENQEFKTSLYSDAGDGFGPTRIDRFLLTREEDQIRVDWQRQGDFQFPYREIQIVMHGFKLSSAQVDGQTLVAGQNSIRLTPFQQAVLQIEMNPN
jgi:alpha-glucosidase